MDSPPVDRRLLPHTFGPWFGRFETLREVQRRGIPPILAGRDTLLASATASGKTEAYAAPGAEIAIAAGRPPAALVIVSPTRALANDLKRRLEGPMERIELSFGRYTGEHKERVDGGLPSALVTTPEGLDSLLARRPAALRGIRMLVLDEIHVLDGTARGDQLRLLLYRLDRAADSAPQRILASATIDRPAELAARYLRDAELVIVPGARRILGKRFDGAGLQEMAAHLDALAEAGLRKLLVFCRSRNGVELYAHKLRGVTRFGEAIFAHHGSMAKQARERTEQHFQRAGAAACFATLTLEMGIDIGSVDYVLLANLPSSVDSLLQRIGRGGRRGDANRAGYVVENEAEAHRFSVLFRLAKEGRLCGEPYAFRPAALAQQVEVLACARGSLTAAELSAELDPAVLGPYGPQAAAELLTAARLAGALEKSPGPALVPSEALLARHDRGLTHSCLEDEPGQEVIDRLTGDVLGRIEFGLDNHVGIAGAARHIVHGQGGRLLSDASPGAEPARFQSRGAPRIGLALARATVEALGVPPDAIGSVPGVGRWHLLHGLGSVGVPFLIDQLRGLPGYREPLGMSAFTLTLPGPPPSPWRFSPLRWSPALADQAERLLELFGHNPRSERVPRDWLESTAHQGLGLDRLRAFLETCRLVSISPAPAREILADL